MKYFEHILIIGCIVCLIVCCFLIPNDSKQESVTQQLIVISEQATTIKIQAEKLEILEAEYKNILKTAVDENYSLHKVIEDMTVSMKQMFEYIQRLEELRDRDA